MGVVGDVLVIFITLPLHEAMKVVGNYPKVEESRREDRTGKEWHILKQALEGVLT